MKSDKVKDNTMESSALTQTNGDRLQLATVDSVAPSMDLPIFTLTVNTVTAEVWIYHSDNCPLYNNLMKRVKQLKGRALLNEWFEFNPTYLQRTL